MTVTKRAFSIGDRKCRTCGHIGALDDYAKDVRSKFGRDNFCRSCATKKATTPERRARRKKARRELIEQALESGCVDCGYNDDVRALEFDHVRGVKLYGIKEMISREVSMGRLRTELMKCEVRCANCHAIRTIERRDAKRNASVEE